MEVNDNDKKEIKRRISDTAGKTKQDESGKNISSIRMAIVEQRVVVVHIKSDDSIIRVINIDKCIMPDELLLKKLLLDNINNDGVNLEMPLHEAELAVLMGQNAVSFKRVLANFPIKADLLGVVNLYF